MISLITTVNSKDHKKAQPAVVIVGINDKALLNAIQKQLITKLETPTAVERSWWINYNKKEIYRILYSFGYFDAVVEPINSKTIKKFKVQLNTRYKLKNINCNYIDRHFNLSQSKLLDITGVQVNKFVTSKQIMTGANKLRDFYKNYAFAFVKVDKPDLQIDEQNKTISVTYFVQLNKKIKIRNTIIQIKSKKDPKLLESFVRNRLPWKEGDYYNFSQIEKVKEAFVEYDLFSGMDISLSDPIPDPNDSNIAWVDINVFLEEAPLRSCEAGITFDTSDLFSISGAWTHHNIDGRGSTFSILANFSKTEKNLNVSHNYYDIFAKKQWINTQVYGKAEDTTSYDSKKYGAQSMLWQSFNNVIEFGVGGSYERFKTIDKAEQNIVNNYSNLYGIPIGLKINSTDNNLDPHKGIKLESFVTPYNFKYTNFLNKLSTYFSFLKKDLVLALYAKYGTIVGAQNIKLPRDKLFFSGGANSVRGYGYQKIGPLSSDNTTPTGGNSVIEAGIETRFKFTDTLGGAIFIEAGKIFDRKSSKEQSYMFGYGFGARYYTVLGPIRFDIAFPFKRRKNNNGKYIDSFFHIYLSIGQSF